MNESRDEWAVESRFGDGRMDLCGILWMSKIDETRIYMTPPPLAKGYRPNNRVKTGRAGMGGAAAGGVQISRCHVENRHDRWPKWECRVT
jgi:hypothetical protein